MRTLIKDGLIVDGTGKKGFYGDILIEDDTILAIDTNINLKCDKVIHVKDKVISPGFIDTHSHSDVEALLHKAILPKIHQGITTEILGQDGIAVAPLPLESINMWRKNIGGLDGDSDDLPWAEYTNTKSYLNALKNNHPCLNYAYLAPHGNIRNAVMGFSTSAATEEQLKQMEAILIKELESGAIGLSSGLVYTPCVYSDTNEVIRLCKIVKQFNGIFVVHQRNEGHNILESMEELYTICKQTKVDLHISHFKLLSSRMEPRINEVFDILNKIQNLGVQVTCDQYPYTSGSTMLGTVVPAWVSEGGTDKMLERITYPEIRSKIKDELYNPDSNWNNGKKTTGGARYLVTSLHHTENQKYVGKRISEIAKMQGKDDVEACLDLLHSEDNKVGAVCFYDTDEAMYKILALPNVNICTDGLLQGMPHPRVYGSFPRILGKFVREEHILSLEEAVRKMTSQAANAMHISNRGYLKPGYKADIVVFDMDSIKDIGTYQNPRQYAKGIDYVFVNGVKVLDHGVVNENADSGEIIYR